MIVRIKVRRWLVETWFTHGGLLLLRWRLLARSTGGGLLLLSLLGFRCRRSNIALHVNLSRHYIQPQFTAGFTQNKLHDISHDETIFGVWMELLRAVPHSRLRLQECAESAKETLRSIAVAHGIADTSRLVFNAKIGDYYQHIERLGNCRLFLDAPKYNAHTSAGDALWAGVPVITGTSV